MMDLIGDLVCPQDWIANGGTANAVFEVSDHLVVAATARAHIGIERLLKNLRDAASAEPWIPPHQLLENPRAFAIEREYVPGLLDNIRLARTISIESLRAAGPNFADGVTEEELNGCDRGAFGLLDKLRR